MNILTAALDRILKRHVTPEPDWSPVFNVSAMPIEVADGITLDSLIAMLRESRGGNADRIWSLASHITSSDTTFIAGGFQRRGPLVARPSYVVTGDKSDPVAVARTVALRAQWAQATGKSASIAHLLESSVWPVTFAQKIWKAAPVGAGYYWDLAGLVPVPFWRITFAGDSTAPTGVPKIKCLDAAGNWNGKTVLPDPLHYVQHRGHLLQSNPDCWMGPLRATVFWWYFGAWARQACANHLEGHNQPKWIGKYPRTDSQRAKRELLAAFNKAVTTTALIIPEDAKIEAVQTLKSDTATAFLEFIRLCQREIAKVIIVQTLTLEAQAQGLGSGQSGVQQDALDGVREFDAAMLSETIREQVFRSWLDINAMPGGPVPELSWKGDDGDAAVKAEMLSDLKLAGIRVRADGLPKLSTVIGLPLEMVPDGASTLSAFSVLPGPSVPAAARAATDAIADRTAADLAQAFGADFADLSRALRDATTPADLITRLRPAVAGLQPHRATRIVEECLAAAAANGLLCGHHAAGS